MSNSGGRGFGVGTLASDFSSSLLLGASEDLVLLDFEAKIAAACAAAAPSRGGPRGPPRAAGCRRGTRDTKVK